MPIRAGTYGPGLSQSTFSHRSGCGSESCSAISVLSSPVVIFMMVTRRQTSFAVSRVAALRAIMPNLLWKYHQATRDRN